MRHSVGDYLPSFLNQITGYGVLLTGFLFEVRFQTNGQAADQTGIAVIVPGRPLVAWFLTAVGGDDAVSVVTNMPVGLNIPLAIIVPPGTGNLLACQLGILRQMEVDK